MSRLQRQPYLSFREHLNENSSELLQDESIYNLIPKEIEKPAKQKRYKSTHKYDQPPTASTLCLKNTSIINAANIAGSYDFKNFQVHPNTGETLTLGHPKDYYFKLSKSYLKKQSGNSYKNRFMSQSQENATKFNYNPQFKKPAVPKKEEEPIHGLTSTKDFIVANATEAILSTPRLPKIERRYTEKKEFGKIPLYLQKIKSSIQYEYDKIRMIQEEDEIQKQQTKYLLSDEELNSLKLELKKKFDTVFHEYNNYSHITKIDTVGLKRRKENREKQLSLLEKDISKLNKQYIFIDTDR